MQSKYAKILSATTQHLVTTATWCLGVMHP